MIEEGRAARRVPDLAIRVRALGRARAQDDRVQEQPSPDRADVEHTRIGEELGEVAAHRARRRLVGRAEVDEQEAGGHACSYQRPIKLSTASCRSCNANGLGRNAASPTDASSSLVGGWPLTNRNGVAMPAARAVRATATPDRSGRNTSHTTRSKCSAPNTRWMSSLPDFASTTAADITRSIPHRAPRTRSLSSATRTRISPSRSYTEPRRAPGVDG